MSNLIKIPAYQRKLIEAYAKKWGVTFNQALANIIDDGLSQHAGEPS